MLQIVRFPSKHVWSIHYLFGILESISRSCFLLWHPKLKSINTNLLSMFLFWSFIPHFVSIILKDFYRWITWINRNCCSNKINNQEFPFWVNKYSEIENEGYQKFLVLYFTTNNPAYVCPLGYIFSSLFTYIVFVTEYAGLKWSLFVFLQVIKLKR